MEEDDYGDIFWSPDWYDNTISEDIAKAIRKAFVSVCRVLGSEARKKGRAVSLAPFRYECGEEVEDTYGLIRAVAFPDIRVLPKFNGPDFMSSIMERHGCAKPREQLAFSAGFFEKPLPPNLWNERYAANILSETFGEAAKYSFSESDLVNMRKGYFAYQKMDRNFNSAPRLYDLIFPLNLIVIYDDSPEIGAIWEVEYGAIKGDDLEINVVDFSREGFEKELVRAGLRFLRSVNPAGMKKF